MLFIALRSSDGVVCLHCHHLGTKGQRCGAGRPHCNPWKHQTRQTPSELSSDASRHTFRYRFLKFTLGLFVMGAWSEPGHCHCSANMAWASVAPWLWIIFQTCSSTGDPTKLPAVPPKCPSPAGGKWCEDLKLTWCAEQAGDVYILDSQGPRAQRRCQSASQLPLWLMTNTPIMMLSSLQPGIVVVYCS